MKDPTQLPGDLPVPEDDGAADHLRGMPVPPIALPAEDVLYPVFPPDRSAADALARLAAIA